LAVYRNAIRIGQENGIKINLFLLQEAGKLDS